MAKFDQFEKVDNKEVGKGAFSKVYRVKTKNNSQIYAMKTILKNNLSSRDRLDLQNEIQIHQKLNHPHIIRFLDYEENKDSFQILLENAPNGCLFYFIHHREGLPEFLALKFTYQLSQAVKYLHQRTIAHRDIKPENVLFDRNFNVKLCDFGWATEISTNTLRTSVCGTSEYMSPEILSKKLHCKKVDIWCLGVFLYELLMGRPPFEGKNQEELVNNILSKRIMIKKNISKETRNLLKGLLQRNEKKRFNIYQVLDHQAFRDKLVQFNQPMKQKHFNLLVRNFLIKSLGGSNMILPESFANLDLKNYFQKSTTKFGHDEVPIDEDKEKDKEPSPQKKEEQMLERIKQKLMNKGIDVDSLRNLKKVDSFRHNSNSNQIQSEVQNPNFYQPQKHNSFSHQHSNFSNGQSHLKHNAHSKGISEFQKRSNSFQQNPIQKNEQQNYQKSSINSRQNSLQQFNGHNDVKFDYTRQDQKDIQSKKVEPPQIFQTNFQNKNQSFSKQYQTYNNENQNKYKQNQKYEWEKIIEKHRQNFQELKLQNQKIDQNKQIIPSNDNQIYKRENTQPSSFRNITSFNFQNQNSFQQNGYQPQRSNSMRLMNTTSFSGQILIPQRENNYYSRGQEQKNLNRHAQSFSTNYRSNSMNKININNNIINDTQNQTIYDNKIQSNKNQNQNNKVFNKVNRESYHNVYGDVKNDLKNDQVNNQVTRSRQDTLEKRTPSKRVISLSRYNSNKDIYSQLELKQTPNFDNNNQDTQSTTNMQNQKLHNIYSKFSSQNNDYIKPRHYSTLSYNSTKNYYNNQQIFQINIFLIIYFNEQKIF